jgi:hypothetical protein
VRSSAGPGREERTDSHVPRDSTPTAGRKHV